jgi:hypothetical protein
MSLVLPAAEPAAGALAARDEPTPHPAPELLPIAALHRHDGYVAFAFKDGDAFRLRVAIRANALDSYFPQFLDELAKNSLVSLNGSHRIASRRRDPFGYPFHRNESLRYLCACYCDLDFYKRGLNFAQVSSEVLRLFENGILPWASVIVDSGHGMWLLWLLHDETDPSTAHLGAFADCPFDHLQLYSKVNRAIGQRLSALGADLGAIDGARYIRVPGSFRTDYERYIHWEFQAQAYRRCSYTLKGLAEFFLIPLEKRLPQEAEAALEARGRCPNRSKGWRATNRNRLAAFMALKDLRAGGFDAGCRNHAAFVYVSSLRATGVLKRDAFQRLQAMATLCRPPLSGSECVGAVKSVWKQRSFKLSYHRMADLLKVSPREAEVISQMIRRPFPAATSFASCPPAVSLAREQKLVERQAERRLKIRLIANHLGQPPSYRAMKSMLFERGTSASHVTIKADYEALGLVSNQVARRMAIAASCRSQLPLHPPRSQA